MKGYELTVEATDNFFYRYYFSSMAKLSKRLTNLRKTVLRNKKPYTITISEQVWTPHKQAVVALMNSDSNPIIADTKIIFSLTEEQEQAK